MTEGSVLQAKGFPYPLLDLLGDPELVRYYRNGRYATLRLTSSMYHRFHAPYDCRVEQVNYISGDTWNVNPPALARVEKLFCKNERAVIRCRLPSGALLTLVPVAAILVASIRLKFLDVRLHLRYRGPKLIPCDVGLRRGEEMGWFEHGSTIIVFAPHGMELCAEIGEGRRIQMGQALMDLGSTSITAVCDAVSGVTAMDASTAILTATPLLTCSRMTERGPSATSEAISTPRFIGPGCITSTLGEASLSRFASSPKSRK